MTEPDITPDTYNKNPKNEDTTIDNINQNGHELYLTNDNLRNNEELNVTNDNYVYPDNTRNDNTKTTNDSQNKEQKIPFPEDSKPPPTADNPQSSIEPTILPTPINQPVIQQYNVQNIQPVIIQQNDSNLQQQNIIIKDIERKKKCCDDNCKRSCKNCCKKFWTAVGYIFFCLCICLCMICGGGRY